jgi:Cytochrome P460
MNAARIAAIALLSCSAMSADNQPTDEDLLKRVKDPHQLIRFTKERVGLAGRLVTDCGLPDPNHAELLGGLQAAIQVYVTPESFASFVNEEAKFPVGTIILKEKFPTMDAKAAELYTGMLKREKGYNPKAGDWEFFVLTGDRNAVTARGRIDSCMDCHQQYAKSDFVTKRYRSAFLKR